MSVFEEVPEAVVKIAEEIINEYHPNLKIFQIGFVFKQDENFKKKPYQIWARASKVSAKYQAFLNFDFLIWIQYEIWEELNDLSRHALIDHELCHCGINDKMLPVMVPHDVEEFAEIVDRYGLWRSNLVEMGKAMKGYVQAEIPVVDISAPNGKVFTLTPEQIKNLNESRLR